MSIKRYEPRFVKDGGLGVPSLEMNANIYGQFVTYEDHAAELSRLNTDAALAEKSLKEANDVVLKAHEKFNAQNAEIDALREQVRALAAENANMRNAIDQTIGWQESVDAENTESVRMLVDLRTPDTDAILREVGARAVTGATSHLLALSGTSGDLSLSAAALAVQIYANSIRAGEVQQ